MTRAKLLCWLLLPATKASYNNVTLKSRHANLEVTIFLPIGVGGGDTENTFYQSSRFEHSSMIGSIRRQSTVQGSDRTRKDADVPKPTTDDEDEGDEEHDEEEDEEDAESLSSGTKQSHELYGAELWRVPHDPRWPESGLGLASEFGVGSDGAFCTYRCGWHAVDNVTNGLLGYEEARVGESFLKLGVGELIKGSCAACDSTFDYKFNSEYEFAKQPNWTFSQPMKNMVVLEHEARLRRHGYRTRKQIVIQGENELQVKTTLTNLGSDPFQTVWYSHHFFSCDAVPIGPEYTVDLGLRETIPGYLYEEQDFSAGLSPLSDYARILSHGEYTRVQFTKDIEPGTRIKTEFIRDEGTKGKFVLHGCDTSIVEDIVEFTAYPFDPINMYAYNLYIERGIVSPEPQLLISLAPNQSKTWTQRLVFKDRPNNNKPTETADKFAAGDVMNLQAFNLGAYHRVRRFDSFSLALSCTMVALSCYLARSLARIANRLSSYSAIPDLERH